MSILIDDAGWGCLLGGTLIGAYQTKGEEMHIEEIPVEYFQGARFLRQEYLDAATKAVKKLLLGLGVVREDILICTGYVLKDARAMLAREGYNWRSGRITGPFQDAVEKEALVYVERFTGLKLDSTSDYRDSFMACLAWLKGDNLDDGLPLPERERFAKTGWPSYPIWAYNPLDLAKALTRERRER